VIRLSAWHPIVMVRVALLHRGALAHWAVTWKAPAVMDRIAADTRAL